MTTDDVAKGEAAGKLAHTRGPWVWHTRKHDDGRNDGSVLADVESGRARCICKAPQYETNEQWSANATLMAAAPDMLAALERIEPMARDYVHNWPKNSAPYKQWQAVLDALAKARGERG